MVYCPGCYAKLNEEDIKWPCPYCDEEGYEPYIFCKNCEMPITTDGEFWECEYCENQGGFQREWLKI